MHLLRYITPVAFIACVLTAHAGGPAVPLTANQGQWPSNVLYRSMLSNNAVFVERDALTFVLWSGLGHEHHGVDHDHTQHQEAKMHAYRMTFVGGAAQYHEGAEPQPHYENYFLGNDTSRWAGEVPVYAETYLHELYPGIDLKVSGHSALKYDLVVAPNTSPDQIILQYDGADELQLQDGKLLVHTSAGTTIEQAPYAYQIIDGAEQTVPCHYQLSGNQLRFDLPAGYDDSHELVIDPILSFSTYTGSAANNFGSTATYDSSGHLYGGGTAFAVGYPTTLGALDVAFNGGSTDMALTKFSPDGTNLIWSTYIGGTEDENPHSLVVNSNNELYVLGTSGSADFPTTFGAFDGTFGGGPSVSFTNGYGFQHNNGCDIVVCFLNTAGSTMNGATYLGGSGNDGINENPSLVYNYGDPFRGEIALDQNDDPVIASMTQSGNAFTTPGAPQTSYGGVQDGYLVRMSDDLMTMNWGTFLGGSSSDAAYGVQFDATGNLFVAGGTNSSNLPMTGSPFHGSSQGGVDGFVMRYNTSGALTASTYVGTGSYDQCYFVQIDTNDDVYLLGQSEGSYPISPGVFNEPNSGQFIHKLNNSLSTNIWSTVVGSGNGGVDISPTAFLVSDCRQIYVSGWGSSIQSGNLSTSGLTVTGNAYQPTTDGNDLYLMLLAPDATGLVYATYFGGSISTEHVDGGTSRFDKDGTVYQAVCAGCGGNNDFPSTAGAWSAVNGSSCNLGVFKFALTQNIAQIDISGPPYICLPGGVQFVNNSIGGNNYFWDFGDTNTSTDFAPFHTYTATGTYTVMMVLHDTSGCTLNDTTLLTIEVLDPLDALVQPADTICVGDSVQLFASGGTTYTWFPTTGLSDPTIADPLASPASNTTYFVIVEDQCSIDTVSVEVVIGQPNGGAGPDATVCIGDQVQISANGGGTYQWSPSATLDDPASATPFATPLDTTIYSVVITTPSGCILSDSLQVNVQFLPPSTLNNDTAVCPGGSVQLIASGGDTYQWQPAPGITTLNVAQPTVTPPQTMTYVVDIGNTCGNVLDSVLVEVIEVVADAWPDTLICPGDTVTLYASGGITYQWSPGGSMDRTDSSIVNVWPPSPTEYKVAVTDI